MGVRRCGKSTFMEGIMQQLAEGGVSRENMVWINFADDRLSPLALEGLGGIHEAYYGMFPEKRHREKVYFFLTKSRYFPSGSFSWSVCGGKKNVIYTLRVLPRACFPVRSERR